ncbi:MAG: SDR family oxidoreductase [Acidimicrobiales bacterium]
MSVLITGGRGTFGQLLAPRLEAAGTHVTIGSRSSGADRVALDVSKPIDPKQLTGISTVVHAASDPARATSVDIGGTERLLRACEAAGTEHFVYLSIVGIDDHPFPYYRAKVAAERLIEASDVPHSIIRATQFHEFLAKIFSTSPVVVRFVGLEFQVIDGGTVADRVAEMVGVGPSLRVPDIGGPRGESMKHMASSWKRASGSRRPIVPIPVFGNAAAAFKERRHFTDNTRADSPTWDSWLASQTW